jgi:hypothetical protein
VSEEIEPSPCAGDGSCQARVRDLRSSNAALIAENEALKDRVRVQNLEGINPFKITIREYDALQAKLSLYTSWQPSDPGTKEAMKTCRPQSDEEGEKRMSWVDTAMTLSHALTAAMVRLEEAEKELKLIKDSSTDDRIPFAERKFPTRQDMRVEIAALQERIRHLESVNALPCGPDQVAALTASLAELRNKTGGK